MIEGYTYDFYRKAATYIEERLSDKPSLAIVLGTGLSPLASKIESPLVMDYRDIPGFPVSTNPSHAGKLIAGYLEGKYVLCMNGRFHYYEGYSMEELGIPVGVFHLLGIDKLILTNAAGSCNPSFRPGDVMIIKDHIKLFLGSSVRGPNVPELGPRFFGVSDLYSTELRKKALSCTEGIPLNVNEGVYMFFPGPQFETASEIKAARILGSDAIGMSTVPEALAAAHCNMKLFALSLITNMATGMEEGNMDGSEVDSVAQKASAPLVAYLERIIRAF